MQIIPSLETLKPSYIREILKVASGENVISFAGGLPSPETFPMPIIKEVMNRISGDRSLFQYTETSGHRPLVNELRQRYQVPSSHDILITSGSQQGLDICARTFVAQGDKVVVEDPSYLGALQIFSLVGANVQGVEQQDDGPNVEQLEQLFKQGGVKLFYAVPDFHNPTGCCWSLAKRQAIAALCIDYQILLIEDAPYRSLRFYGDELPTVSSFCPDESILLYSYSKVIAPGCRIGALISPKRWSSTLNVVKQATDLHTNVPMQQLVVDIITHPEFDQHVAITRNTYRERYEVLVNELTKLPAGSYSFAKVNGGMFVWLSIPSCDLTALAASAIERGVAIVPGAEFYINSDYANSALRLNFTHSSPKDIILGMSRLKPALREYA